MIKENKLEILVNKTKQLNNSALNLGLYGKPLYKVKRDLINEYHKRESFDMLNKLYESIKVFEKKYVN